MYKVLVTDLAFHCVRSPWDLKKGLKCLLLYCTIFLKVC